MDAQDRRQHARHRVLRVEVHVATAESFRASYLRDVSHGGLFVRSGKPLPIGTRVVVRLSVAAGEPLMLPGAVVRIAEGGFGVRFDDPTPEQRAALDALINAAAPAPTAADLAAELAEARGAIEAYEQTIALLRESESEALQRAEVLELERSVLADAVKDLTTRLAAIEKERARLSKLAADTQARLAAREQQHRAELEQARAVIKRTTTEHEASVLELSRLENEQTAAARLRAGLEHELEALRSALDHDDARTLYAEIQELHSQLDDERLKALALQRALERFVAMGGQIPTRNE